MCARACLPGQVNIQRNELTAKGHAAEYEKLIASLRDEISSLRTQLSDTEIKALEEVAEEEELAGPNKKASAAPGRSRARKSTQAVWSFAAKAVMQGMAPRASQENPDENEELNVLQTCDEDNASDGLSPRSRSSKRSCR